MANVKQRIIRNLGRKEEVERRGDLDRLIRSAARLAQRSMVFSTADDLPATQEAPQIGRNLPERQPAASPLHG